MLNDMIERLKTNPRHRTLGELLLERQWAVDEILRLRIELEKMTVKPMLKAACRPEESVLFRISL